MTPTNADLRQFILQFFSDEELETLCFDYFREAQQNFSDGMTKNRKVILLIGYCDTRDRLTDLYAALERERPTAWREKFGAPPVETFRRNVSTPPTLTRDPHQVFLSHATADAEFAQRLAGDLRAEGWRVWIAPDSIRPGEKWVEAIERGVETSGVFVVALTPAAVASRWVRTETDTAIELEHQSKIRFLSLHVAESAVPLLWRRYQHVPFDSSYEVGLDTLLRWLEDPAANVPLLEMKQPSPPFGKSEGMRSRSPAQERRVKEEQWRQLQALAHEIAAELERQSGDDELREVYRRFNHEFGLTTYKKLSRRQFAEGLAFLTAWLNEVVTVTPPIETKFGPVFSTADASAEMDRESASAKPDVSAEPDESAIAPVPPLYNAPAFPGYRTLSPDRIVHEKTEIEFVRVPAGLFLYDDKIKAQRSLELLFGKT